MTNSALNKTKKFQLKLSPFYEYIDGFLHLLFPSTCVICQTELSKSEKICCSICSSELAYTHFENSLESTSLDQLFLGRVPVHSSYSLLYYEKTNNVKPLLQSLKYGNRPDVGFYFGYQLGLRIKKNSNFSTVEVLIPVPIHRKKKYIRGYNQSEHLVKGIASTWDIPYKTDLLLRTKHTESQTKLGRFGRWDNVEGLFLAKATIQQYKHIVLVDDVITTGATLEVIMRCIYKVAPDIKISIISLAVAK